MLPAPSKPQTPPPQLLLLLLSLRPFNIRQQVDAFLRYPTVQQVDYNPGQNPTRLAIVYKTPRRVRLWVARNTLSCVSLAADLCVFVTNALPDACVKMDMQDSSHSWHCSLRSPAHANERSEISADLRMLARCSHRPCHSASSPFQHKHHRTHLRSVQICARRRYS